MANKFRTLESHSAEYFGETRDFWWNRDFLELMAKRLSLERIRDVLDVGCGVGHWGQLLINLLPAGAYVRGIDRDPRWVEEASKRALARGLGDQLAYEVATAERMPFADASFDLVTCQTVLIHAADPGIVIDEMIRVARPGGLVLAAEPNNVTSTLILDSLSFRASVDDIIACVRLKLICERGKAALGEGHNSIGDLVPGLFAERGLDDVRVYLNDKTNALIPPYDTPEHRALLEESFDTTDRDFWVWSRKDTQRYFLAGGGDESEFDELWSAAMGDVERFKKAIAESTYSSSGAAIQYLVAGRKPV
jgi:SAM-dependent methyltransferase